MGYYINPQDGRTKEQWLRDEAREVPPSELTLTPAELPVVLIDNGPFTAAGIAWCVEELVEFTRPCDPRRKRYFMASRDKLSPYMPKRA